MPMKGPDQYGWKDNRPQPIPIKIFRKQIRHWIYDRVNENGCVLAAKNPAAGGEVCYK